VRHSYSILIAKLERNRPLGISRYKWEDNIRMDVREIWWELWTEFIWLRIRDHWRAVVKTVMNVWVP